MKKFSLFGFTFILLFAAGCANEALRNTEKFSPFKKYAILPLGCQDPAISERLTESFRNWLRTYDYDIIGKEELNTLLAKSKLTADSIVKNYACALGNLKGVDGIILGYIHLDRKDPGVQGSMESTSTSYGSDGRTNVVNEKLVPQGAGSVKNYISSCDIYAIDVNSGEILASGVYQAPATSVNVGSILLEDLGKKLALMLSPH